jgi:hypothetical protein
MVTTASTATVTVMPTVSRREHDVIRAAYPTLDESKHPSGRQPEASCSRGEPRAGRAGPNLGIGGGTTRVGSCG